ncbi:3-oxoacyl-(acyl carrier protein) synthase II [Brucella intermedia LMG 3301]|uniref:3-oxoacyl-(Acyl carrier protein) synthase II n=1 Tax=Brucella intermedia LMG 3301 TaxID=641118 RepID=C4WNT3_9HYPH|nr:3-oxoacyl-(acyl carrier protein) synthase II [Brucella intermedia LMG 3301]
MRNDRLTAPCLRRTDERPIGDAARLIRSNEADTAICVGTEACVIKVSLAGFAAARSLSTGFNETPEKASRSFDAGFVMGEGAGILVIEAFTQALARSSYHIWSGRRQRHTPGNRDCNISGIRSS